MDIKNLILGGLVGLVALFGGLYVLQPHAAPTTTPSFGAVSSPDIPSPYFSFGGVRFDAVHTDAMYQASTTVCSLQSPAATSTLSEGSGVRFTVSSTTASTATVYKASFPTGNTTFLFADNIAAGAQSTIVATTTTNNFVIAPNQYINVIMSGGTGTFSPTGTCGMVFQEL